MCTSSNFAPRELNNVPEECVGVSISCIRFRVAIRQDFILLYQITDSALFFVVSQKLMGVEAFLAHHHAGDVGPPPAWGGIADDGPDAPCAVAGMFGCAPMNSTYDYWKNGVPWEGPPVVFH